MNRKFPNPRSPSLARHGKSAWSLRRFRRAVPLWHSPLEQGDWAMATDIDLHLGRRLRRRRRLLGLTQQQLAIQVGIRFQQIQKYECGANCISAARLCQLFEALETPISYFYDGLAEAMERKETASANGGEMFSRKETLDLIQAYYQLGERPRRRLLDLAKSLHSEADAVAS